MTFQVQNLREKNLPINRIDRLNSLVEFKRYVLHKQSVELQNTSIN